jgi:5-methylcytosine-specific restriction protein A
MAHWPYNTGRWQRLRAAKLRETPCCEDCTKRGRTAVANTVDHRTAINAGGDPFPPLSGLASLCASCHGITTNARDRPDRRAGRGLLRGCDAEGWPLYPAHPFLVGDSAEPTPGRDGADGQPRVGGIKTYRSSTCRTGGGLHFYEFKDLKCR